MKRRERDEEEGWMINLRRGGWRRRERETRKEGGGEGARE
jgi:hypothetical protein